MRLNVQCAGAALLCALPCTLLSAVLGTLSLPAVAADDAITPYRPSVSNSAQLPLPGQLELELGGLHARSGDAQVLAALTYSPRLTFDAGLTRSLNSAQEWSLFAGVVLPIAKLW